MKYVFYHFYWWLSKYTYVYLMKHKDQVFQMFKNYKFKVENQKGKKIKIIRSDKSCEYFSKEFYSFCEENGIIYQTRFYIHPNKIAWQNERINICWYA